jgi:GNAT superfamily N-acetyltransferase
MASAAAACGDEGRRLVSDHRSILVPTDSPPSGMFNALYAAIETSSLAQIGPAQARLLVIPLRDDGGAVRGGLWGHTQFGWLHVQMLFVPEVLRGLGIGTALLASAEAEARVRGCRGVHVDAFSFQAVGFYRKLGFVPFGTLNDFPPGHARVFFQKRL